MIRTGESNVLVADVTLDKAPVQLDSVTVVGRGGALAGTDGRSIGGDERDVTGGALFSLDPSDLSALAAAVPGVTYIPGVNGGPGSYSVLGARPDQNNVLLDGSTFGGSALPPDAIASASIATTTFDPARGQFSGGQLSIRTRRGTDLFDATFRGALADPHLAWADPASPTPIARNLNWSGTVSGPIKRGVAHFMAGYSNNVSTSDLQSLLSLNHTLLTQYGLSRDTIDALASTLGALGVPTTTGEIPSDNTRLNRSAIVRLDATPTATTSLTLTGTWGRSSQLGGGISALGFPSQGNQNESTNMGLQLSASGYVAGLVDELKTSIQSSSSHADPFLTLPKGSVRVGAQYADGNSGITSLNFGGGTGGLSRNESRSWETSNELSWMTEDSRTRIKFGQSLTYHWTTSRNVSDPFGVFTYQSLEDLAANRPASYSRTLSSFERSTKSTNAALWLGGEWRTPSSAFQLQYGFRLDMAHSGTVPEYNPVIDTLFGRRTDEVPNDLGLSPRIGFSWTPGGAAARPTPMSFLLAQRGQYRPPITISGGIGAFRGVIQPGRIASLVDATGLPNTVRQLTCVGDATPVPDWSHYLEDGSTVPDQCLDGSAPAEFSTDKPSVTMFDPSYHAPLSWRANAQVSGLSFKGWPISVSGTYSLGLNGESGVDLNLRRTPVFTLANEGNRPVYVPPSGIVPTTGVVAPGASRITDRFGSVMSYQSDLRSTAFQITLSATKPQPIFGKLPLTLSYTYNYARAQQRGFDGSTAGDPFVREWAPATQPTHQFTLSTSFGIRWISLSVQAQLTSGIPYTPMVSGDVNGDGRNDDRAFVFDPATVSDTVLASEMRSLLATATPRTRACLEAQLGRIAGRNSCHTGWKLRPNINFNFNLPGQNLGIGGLGDRLQFQVTTVNAMGAMLRALGLADTPLGQIAGANDVLDPTLLYVDGFDPATQQFRYRVNQQFGEGRPRRYRSSRFSGPFQVQLGASLHFGGPPHVSMARQLGLVHADKDAAPLTPAQVKERLHALTNNPVTSFVQMKDSLLLTEEQVKTIEGINARFEAQSDSLLAPIVDYVTKRGDKIKDKDLQKRLGKVMPHMQKAMLSAVLEVSKVLTDEQKKRLPPTQQVMLQMAELQKH
ncbi:MAG: Spy/CpxP family protein refolding chaperone [Gemmatimonadaceae bacterium]|nr:Spy/CpxP family protein refolding chaperone [Gemmatimonadaceae bacterium]